MTAAFVGVMVVAPSASAESSPSGCPRGYFCAYSGYYQSGAVLLKTSGNWSGTVYGVHSLFNNGYTDPGADHVDYRFLWGGGGPYTECLHFNPGPGDYKVNWGSEITLTGVTWRDEC
ncbi:peptidase inhibitor family I36 protein [Streptomyces sp. BE303]|uniref:peptidase inhibitor family I36 protein n=1 Tax=Streptomyces sp. BE303 TaxID=3002528 RepID=UPI002E789CE1|nr:peptidase inhibitor family I36 protein [Streptomyces sp. BE303]MED7951092.1 peptidase inhibitor family I36 protein [Streptomyces sp. BE303]